MPKRTDIEKILMIGSGPIVIGQAAEFDYSGTQALKALKRAGYRLIVVNSNSATIMTDPELSDAVYIEPLTVEFLEAIIAKERPDVLLPTLGGQTALNLAVALAESGVLEKYGVEIIGAPLEAIRRAEDRELFKETMLSIGLEVPRSQQIGSLHEAIAVTEELGYPLIVRPSFTLGGTGGGVAYNTEELERVVARGLIESPAHTVLLEESVIGWKEYELEVMRDNAGNGIVVCSIENLDPMGIHTGDSITVAPAQTIMSMFVLGYQVVESLFVATAILATSVGISVKVLQDMGLIKHKVAYIVLGAAVLDDILALICLALVKGLARREFQTVEFTLLVVESLAFVGFLTLWGPKLAKRTHKWIERLNIPEGPFVFSVILCLGLAELADIIGLAAIIGAFMAGIVIDELAGVYELENKVKYVNELLLPFFFVMMGAHLDPMSFLKPRLLFLVVVISLIAALSKMIGAWLASLKHKIKIRIQTGVCMIPRGEVGIIVGLIGLSLHTITQEIYTVVISMSLVTTIITPPLIHLTFRKK